MFKGMTGKLIKRGWMILQALLKNYSSPLFNAVLAWIVIRKYDAGLWGDFVKVQLFVMLSSQFCNWSSKTQLLRRFSSSPATMYDDWQRSFSQRIPLLLLPVSLSFILLADVKLALISILWLAARYMILSYEPVILFKRMYVIGILADLFSFAAAMSVVLFMKELSVPLITAVIAVAETCEAILLVFIFKSSFRATLSKLTGTFLRDSGWLFLLAFSAFAGMRADLLCAAFYLSKEELAFYQVFVNFLLGLQSLSNILIMPYVQNYFRMSAERIYKAAGRLFLYGLVICTVAAPAIIFVLQKIYKLPATPVHALLAVAYALPVYYYTLISYILLRSNHDRDVFLVNITGVAANIGLAVLLLPLYGVTGGVLAASVSHVLILVLYFFRVRNRNFRMVPAETGRSL